MAWFEKEMDYARESLEQVSRTAIDHAGERLDAVVREGIAHAGGEVREVVLQASREIDAKLDTISAEIHNQRQFTKADVREMVDYAGERLGAVVDQRTRVMKAEIAALVEEKVDYLKHEVDAFFIRRQQDLARERRRLAVNVLAAAGASLAMGALSLMFHRLSQGTLDLLDLFRILLAALGAGYAVYMAVNAVRRYRAMAEHRKDLFFLVMKYGGLLRPASIFAHLLLAAALAALAMLLYFPEHLGRWLGNDAVLRWAAQLRGR